ncbi:MAG: 3-phosphoshikimate 1-carboxyvinyltransferase [Tumebacillaceae bacterium]
MVEDFRPDLQARSTWAELQDVKVAVVSPPVRPLDHDIVVPGSKSFTNRALIIGALARGRSRLSGILRSDDSFWCMETLKKLGVQLDVQEDVVEVEGVNGAWPVHEADVYIGAAGTTARFLPGALAGAKQGRWVIRASKRMSERPMRTLLQALQDIGAEIRYLEQAGHLPIEVVGSGLRGGDVNISGSTSSQFISGLLIASAYAEEEVRIHVVDPIVQHAYVKITLDLMKEFGVDVRYDEALSELVVTPSGYVGRDVQLEADASTSCYFLALAALTNGRVRIQNLSYETHQPDRFMIDVLEQIGCQVTRGDGFVEVRGTERLKGGFDISMKEMSDQTLTLAAIAPFADGPIAIHDVAHIRHHESDRIAVICESLRKMGIEVEEREDGLTVYPGLPRAVELNSYDDHRVAMSLSLIGARVPGMRILDPGCVSKTCPSFYTELRKLGFGVELEI